MLIFQLDSDLVHDSTPRDIWLSHRASGRSTALILTQYKIWVVMLQRVYPTSMNCDTVSSTCGTALNNAQSTRVQLKACIRCEHMLKREYVIR